MMDEGLGDFWTILKSFGTCSFPLPSAAPSIPHLRPTPHPRPVQPLSRRGKPKHAIDSPIDEPLAQHLPCPCHLPLKLALHLNESLHLFISTSPAPVFVSPQMYVKKSRSGRTDVNNAMLIGC
jgi:hypothetical protein